MPKEIIQVTGSSPPVGPYSPAVKVGPLLFISGQIPVDATGLRIAGGAGKETERCLENLKAVLESAGATMDHVVKVTVFMTDIAAFKFMNMAYEKFFTQNFPARSTVQVAKLPKDVHVEIEAIAVIA